MSKWLVTGGEGFIGGRIVGLTDAAHYDLKSGKDILDTEKLRSECEGVSGIFHCAAKISVPESIEQPEQYYRNNVAGTESVIAVAKGVDAKVIFSSSAAVYGDTDVVVGEDAPLSPKSPYAENKRDGEMLLEDSGIPSVNLRYFNVYGPGQSAAYAGVITAFIQCALKNEEIVIYGDGEQTRDFVFVDDVARANIAAMSSDVQSGEAMNIASGASVSINELARMLLALTGSSSTIRYEAERAGDIRHSQANVEKAARLLDWRAQVSLEEGLRSTIDSYRS